MGELLARAFTEQALLDAWDEVRDAALADGVAGPEIDRFEASAARRISQLAGELTDGTFSPQPAVAVEIAKGGGGVRRLAVPSVTDRIVERALLAELDAVIDPLLLPWSFAYRRGLGVRDALACLVEAREAGSAWVARCDIDDCFEHIPRWEVLRRLREVVPDAEAVDLVRRLMDRPVIRERVVRAERGLGLHQGSPLSPLLCNLYLDTFDRAMLAAGYRVIRYSDDMAIPVPDRGGAERALHDAAAELAVLRLDLDPVKSQVVSFDDGVPFLGSTVTATTSPGAMALSHPMETVVYVDRPGSLLRSRGDRLVVEYQSEVLFRLNLRRVRQVVCIGRVGMTTPFLHRALRDGIDVVLLDDHGGPGGRLASLAVSDPTARRAQYRLADDPPAARELARGFVDGKIANMRVALLRAGRRGADALCADVAETLAATRLVLTDVTSIEEIMGHEGSATREYFRAWRQVIGGDWGFTARERRPPPDPVNAMLSFGYTLLVHEAVTALAAAGLDPAVGFLHQARWGRPSLALDLIEEYRPLVVDAVVLRCLTTGIVRPGDFETIPELGCRMSPRARQAFLAAYERRMLTLFSHEPSARRVSYRVGLALQARAVARTILDPGRPYRPVRWK
ncbi:MAG TPA: CRISPR-associated endonuclease Cas1 [Streptosporangiaceae bacterium]|nr:CRISPR-associated endonuclease Cas1 [Streptosporangiaceae bacterium]HVB41441.1 CRISPR-associated endonuclease Cas1 [Streptosporangiaceae bacterium]